MNKNLIFLLILLIGMGGVLSCNPSAVGYEFIELTERWTEGAALGEIECITYDGDDVYLGGYERNEAGLNVPTFWRNVKENKITLSLPQGVSGAKIRGIEVKDGEVYALISSTDGWYYYDGQDYSNSLTDGSDVYNKIHFIDMIDGDIYIAATLEDIDGNDQKLAVFKNGVKDGDIALDPDAHSVYRIRTIFELDGNICIASGYESNDGTNDITFAGYWKNDGSAFVAKGIESGSIMDPVDQKIQVIETIVNDNTYMLNGIEGFTMYVDGEELTLEFPPDPGTGGDAIPVGFSNMLATPDGNDVYIFGAVGTLIQEGSYRYHAVVWNKEGNLETFVDYTDELPDDTGYSYDVVLISEFDDMVDTTYDNLQAVAGTNDYAFPMNKIKKTDKFSVSGYLRRLP